MLFGKKANTAEAVLELIQGLSSEEQAKLEQLISGSGDDEPAQSVENPVPPKGGKDEPTVTTGVESVPDATQSATDNEPTEENTPEHPDAAADAKEIETLIAPLKEEIASIKAQIAELTKKPAQAADDEQSKLNKLAQQYES